MGKKSISTARNSGKTSRFSNPGIYALIGPPTLMLCFKQ
jgi:hypothetical protein